MTVYHHRVTFPGHDPIVTKDDHPYAARQRVARQIGYDLLDGRTWPCRADDIAVERLRVQETVAADLYDRDGKLVLSAGDSLDETAFGAGSMWYRVTPRGAGRWPRYEAGRGPRASVNVAIEYAQPYADDGEVAAIVVETASACGTMVAVARLYLSPEQAELDAMPLLPGEGPGKADAFGGADA